MRKPCVDCTRKHLSQALVLSHELFWYAGNPDDDHLWVCVGHLAEAEAQIQGLSQYVADEIRKQRLLLMKQGVAAVQHLNINNLIGMVTELALQGADHGKQSGVFGAEIPDITEGFESDT